MKRVVSILCILALMVGLFTGCGKSKEDVKIGVSFGVGSASRWVMEKEYMEEKASELGINMEVRLNTTDEPKTQTEDCYEMIDSGIDVLILTPRDVNEIEDVLTYAKEKGVKVVNYARVVLGENVDLFVGYDSNRIGQSLGQYLAETVYTGDYILLKGDEGDHNAKLLYDGSMRYISQIKDDINIILDAAVPKWSPDEAKKMVSQAIQENGNKVDAILAPNDKIAGVCAEVLEELNITTPVVITGMDAELDAARRIVNGQQSITIYMDLQELAHTAVTEAYHMAMNEKVNINAEFNNQSDNSIPSNLITGQLVTKQNIDKILIDSGYYTREEVYDQK